MKRLLIQALLIAFLVLAASTAPAALSNRASRPADPPPATKVTDPEAYDKEVQAANEQRDKDLAEAAKDKQTFEKRKGEIMAQHLAILGKLREKYLEAMDEGKVPPPPPPKQTVAKASKNNAKTKTVAKTSKSGGLLGSLLGAGKSSKSRKSATGNSLADAQANLDDENA